MTGEGASWAGDDSVPFGSNSYHCFIYDGGIIEWDSKQKGFCAGWQVQNIDFSAWDKLRVEIESSDVPLRLRIRDKKNQNESSWNDDGSHSFRINLKNKKQIIGKTEKEGWVKISKPFDFSEGAEIVIEPLNGVYKEGKKTVVEYIKVE